MSKKKFSRFEIPEEHFMGNSTPVVAQGQVPTVQTVQKNVEIDQVQQRQVPTVRFRTCCTKTCSSTGEL